MNAVYNYLLIAFFAISILDFDYFSVSVIGMIIVIRYFYSLFYTKQPRSYLFFYFTGLAIVLVNWRYPTIQLPLTFITLAILECIRIIIMAVLRYPDTIQNFQALTEELERRVEQRTAELRETNLQLQQANLKLLELDQMKTAFVSQASHDLRTPLTAIKGSLDNLMMGVAGELNDKQKKIMLRATRSVDRLTQLINDILDLNRIESGRVTLEKSVISLHTIMEQSLLENQPAAEKKQIRLQASNDAGPIFLHADPSKIERVCGELISNAIKYTPPGGWIQVKLARSGPHAVLTVQDTGIGMTAEECGKIWERFYRTTESQKIAKGSGLGLSIAKELIELHEGSITVDSTPGMVTRFTVTLPLAQSLDTEHEPYDNSNCG
ncbi:MAG TPA: HAMP domain-containing sensor histidine kinase [bacterium]|nr:HAMP domain-containing sensor histidine kinase [bacterium]